jgi:hypothetical protein
MRISFVPDAIRSTPPTNAKEYDMHRAFYVPTYWAMMPAVIDDRPSAMLVTITLLNTLPGIYFM